MDSKTFFMAHVGYIVAAAVILSSLGACKSSIDEAWEDVLVLNCDRRHKYGKIMEHMADIASANQLIMSSRVTNRNDGLFLVSLTRPNGQIAVVPYGSSGIQIIKQFNPFVETSLRNRTLLDKAHEETISGLQQICRL